MEIQKRFRPLDEKPLETGVLEMTSPDLDVIPVKQPSYKGPVIIAESVEDPETMALLWDWGVRSFQGYYIEEPHDALDVDFEELTQCYAMQ